ncbi:hypothetical protein C8R44DRAFT_738888 [Mycena epipterygia]|nr:hypothetical protein C8R44DRAFT_738888 [Mycena epipterygia]
MRFSTTAPSVLLAQLEPSLGLNPGGDCAMYLSRLIGRGRTFEAYVAKLAPRIPLFSATGIARTKMGINAASRPSMDVIVQAAQDIIVVVRLAETPSVQAFGPKFIEATHNQSAYFVVRRVLRNDKLDLYQIAGRTRQRVQIQAAIQARFGTKGRGSITRGSVRLYHTGAMKDKDGDNVGDLREGVLELREHTRIREPVGVDIRKKSREK